MTRRNDGREREIYIYREREREKKGKGEEKMARKKRGKEGGRRSNNLGEPVQCASERRGREEEGERARPRPTKSEARREKIELNWGQIDSSRESLHSIWRLPNRVRLTPFKTFNGPSWKVLKDARVEPS